MSEGEGEGGRNKKQQPSAVASLVSASAHSIITDAPSDCHRRGLHRRARAVLLQLAFKVSNNECEAIHLSLFSLKNFIAKYIMRAQTEILMRRTASKEQVLLLTVNSTTILLAND